MFLYLSLKSKIQLGQMQVEHLHRKMCHETEFGVECRKFYIYVINTGLYSQTGL